MLLRTMLMHHRRYRKQHSTVMTCLRLSLIGVLKKVNAWLEEIAHGAHTSVASVSIRKLTPQNLTWLWPAFSPCMRVQGCTVVGLMGKYGWEEWEVWFSTFLHSWCECTELWSVSNLKEALYGTCFRSTEMWAKLLDISVMRACCQVHKS